MSGKNLPGVKDPKAIRDYVEKSGVTIHKLLSHSSVKTLTKKLKDDSSGYPYKVFATSTLFRLSIEPVVQPEEIGNRVNSLGK